MTGARPTTRRGGLVPLHLCVLAAVTVIVAPAAAGASWHAGLPIAPDRLGYGAPVAALGRQGQAVGAWTVADATGRRMRVEVRARHGHLAPWRVDFTSGLIPTATPALAAAMSPAGAAAVAWRPSGGGVRVATRPPGRRPWSVGRLPESPASAGPLAFASPQVSIADGGAAHVIWAAREDGAWVIRGATRSRRGAAWRHVPPLALGPEAASAAPRLALADDGGAAATWVAFAVGQPPSGVVRAALRTAQGAWSAPATLTTDGGEPIVAAAPGGPARAAWGTPGAAPLVRTAAGDVATGTWGPSGDLAPGGSPRLAVDPLGDVLLAASPAQEPDGLDALLVGPGTPGAGLIRLATPSPQPSAALAPRTGVALSRSGRAVVAWIDPEGPGSATAGMATTRAGGPWQRARHPVGEDVAAPAVAVDPEDDVLVLTSAVGLSGTGRTVLASSFDAKPRPRLRGTVRGRRLRDGRVAWTVTVVNPSGVRADGVRLSVTLCCGARLLSPAPPGARRQGRRVLVAIGRLGPRARASVVLVVGPARAVTGAAPPTDARAIAVAPTQLRGTPLPSGRSTAFPHASR